MVLLSEGHFSHPQFPPAVDLELQPTWPLGVAAQWTVLRYFRDLLSERHKVISNEDPEGVHQIRVAARRVRTALQTFSTLWKAKDLARFLKLFGDFADVFTEARDTDVMLIYLEEQLKTARMPRRSALLWLQEKARETRADEQPRLVEVLDSLEKRRLAAKVVDYFSTHPYNLFEFDAETGTLPEPLEAAPLLLPRDSSPEESVLLLSGPADADLSPAEPEPAGPSPDSSSGPEAGDG